MCMFSCNCRQLALSASVLSSQLMCAAHCCWAAVQCKVGLGNGRRFWSRRCLRRCRSEHGPYCYIQQTIINIGRMYTHPPTLRNPLLLRFFFNIYIDESVMCIRQAFDEETMELYVGNDVALNVRDMHARTHTRTHKHIYL